MTQKPKFLISARKVFLTFPNVDENLTHETIHQNIFSKYTEQQILTIVSARELHENDKPHFHILIAFKKKQTIRNPNHFDFIANKHGNYQSVKSLKHTLTYLYKEKDIKLSGKDLWKPDSKDIKEQLVDFLTKGNSPEQLFSLNNKHINYALWEKPSQSTQYFKLLQAYQRSLKQKQLKWIKSFNIENLDLEFSSNSELNIFYQELRPILLFLNKHMNNRKYKELNLFMYSHLPSQGKTSIMNLIAEQSPCYFWPSDLWFSLYENNMHQFILFDEMSLTGISADFIKQLLAGNSLQLAQKGTSLIKTDNPLTIMSSNHSLRSIVRKKINFQCRCNEHELPEHILCANGKDCKLNLNAESLYLALLARMTVFRITKPLFPTDRCIWDTYANILKKHLIFL